MKARITIAAALFSILMIGLMLGTIVLVARMQAATRTRMVEAERAAAISAEKAAKLALMAAQSNASTPTTQPPAPSEVESLRKENEALRERVKALESASKVNVDPPVQAPPDACVP